MRRWLTALFLLVVVVLLLPLASCTVWRTAPRTQASVARIQGKALLRVRLTNGTKVTLVAPRLERDTLFGRPTYGDLDVIYPEVAFTVGEIADLQVQQLSKGRTTMLVVFVVVVLVVGAFAAGFSGFGFGGWDGSWGSGPP